MYVQKATQSFSIVESNSLETALDLTWSPSGMISVSYVIGDYGGVAAPAWVSVSQNTGDLSISAPSVSSDSTFTFYVNTLVTGVTDPIQKIVTLTILNWVVQNWNLCTSSSSSTCSTWNFGYTLVSGSWVNQQTSSVSSSSSSTSGSSSSTSSSSSSTSSTSTNNTNSSTTEEAKALSTTTQSILGTTIGVVALTSLINASSMSSIWSTINQVQLYFLFLLTKAFIPLDVKTVITGLKITVNPLSFISTGSMESSNSINQKFQFGLSNPILDSFGIESDSTVYNVFYLFLLPFLVALTHLGIYGVQILLFRWIIRENWIAKTVKWAISKIYTILTFGYYIRFILEINQYLLVSSINEIYNWNTSQSSRIVSLISAVLILIFCFVLIIFAFILSLSSYEVIEETHNKLGEFYWGIKMQKKSKIHIPLMLSRRMIFISSLICLTSVNSQILIGVLSFLQLIWFVYLVVLRPYKEFKGNFIEIIWEIYFLTLLTALIWLNSDEKWTKLSTNIYMWIMASSSICITTK